MVVAIGMSAPAAEWPARLKDVGGKVYARRIFSDLSNPSAGIKLASAAVAAGQWPVLSFKIPGNDWRGVASGKYDKQLGTLHTSLAGLVTAGASRVFACLHHEPAKDGTAADWAAMQAHGLPVMKGGNGQIRVGVIGNGWWWSSTGQGYTDSEIAAYIPKSLLPSLDIVASDCYQMSKTGEDGAVKMKNMSKWADRVGVTRLGVGEYNGMTAAAIKNPGDVALSDPKFRFACVWNSNAKSDFTLVGDRLTAFRATLASV